MTSPLRCHGGPLITRNDGPRHPPSAAASTNLSAQRLSNCDLSSMKSLHAPSRPRRRAAKVVRPVNQAGVPMVRRSGRSPPHRSAAIGMCLDHGAAIPQLWSVASFEGFADWRQVSANRDERSKAPSSTLALPQHCFDVVYLSFIMSRHPAWQAPACGTAARQTSLRSNRRGVNLRHGAAGPQRKS